MKQFLVLACILWHCIGATAQKAAENSLNCALTVADVESIFGKGFTAESPTKIGEIQSCRFKQKEYTIQIQIQPAFGMKSTAEYNKMMSPKTVSWQRIENDPDGAMIEVRADKADDLASTPAVAYIRGDKYVRLQILGNYYGYDNTKMPKMREEMRNKLAQLKRVQ
jgi:ribulose bisphosphate carboxylase small subunit